VILAEKQGFGEVGGEKWKSGNEKTTSEDVVFNIWWRIRDSNPGHKDYDSSALTD
jgi:hypothetical protein